MSHELYCANNLGGLPQSFSQAQNLAPPPPPPSFTQMNKKKLNLDWYNFYK